MDPLPCPYKRWLNQGRYIASGRLEGVLEVDAGFQSFGYGRMRKGIGVARSRGIGPVGRLAGDGPGAFSLLPGLSEGECEQTGRIVEHLWTAAEGAFGSLVVPVLAFRHRRTLSALAESLRQLPLLQVRPSEGPAGRELERVLLGLQAHPGCDRRSPGFRVRLGAQLLRVPDRRSAVAVLMVPSELSTYLAGRKRQALRTNLRRAEEHGVVVSEVTQGATQVECVRRIMAARNDSWLEQHGSWLERAAGDGLVRLFAGYGPDGALLTVAVVVADASWAILRLCVSVDGTVAGYSRYATHVYMVDSLIRSGVRALLVDSVLVATPGLRYLQARLGFDPANLAVG